MKEVTKGVQEVGIGDGDKTSDTTSDAAAVPLPDSPGLEPRSEIAGSTEPQEAPLSDELVLTTEEPKQEVTVISEEAVDVGPEEATQVVGRTEESDKERNEKEASLTKLGEEPPDNAAVVLDIDDSVRSQDTHELREETEDAAQKKDEEA